MITLQDYKIEQILYESQYTLIYQSVRKSDSQRVILKKLKEYPSYEKITNFKREFLVTKELKIDEVIKVFDIFNYKNTLIIELEDFGGISLDQFLYPPLEKKQPFTIEQFLNIAIAITTALDKIHQNKIIHKDINPSNIVWNPKTQVLKFIDFGMSTNLAHEDLTHQNRNLIEGTISYISPEQTGRMNRHIDYRTDIYSLGITFYELLTATLPFESEELIEMIHCHMAVKPIAAHFINTAIPETLSQIVMKLMAKKVENRYQSLFSLRQDLIKCQDLLKTNNRITAFKIAEDDRTDHFQVPQKLYGREKELKALANGFEFISKGNKQWFLIRGNAGIGKTMLIKEYQRPSINNIGYFISGKFEQIKKDIPYSCFIQAFKDLVKQILTGNRSLLSYWKETILEAVKENGQIIIDVIPEVQLIIGPQPKVEELPPVESENRFITVMQNFVAALAQSKHPLVIFLDDLQWADSDSLNLIQILMIDDDIQHLQLIGAYRQNEVDSDHPLILTKNSIKKTGQRISEILLEPLTEEHVYQLLEHMFSEKEKNIKELATLVFKKTRGNPFFINQFLYTLHDNQLISFDTEKRRWCWDLEDITSSDFMDNVIDFMISRIRKQTPEAQELLKLAACIGDEFNLFILTSVASNPPLETLRHLWDLIETGYIIPLNSNYTVLQYIDETYHEEKLEELQSLEFRFLHDRVRQSAYSMLSEEEQKLNNLQIGQLMLAKFDHMEYDDGFFKMVTHLNAGRDLITSQEERVLLAELNSTASKKANQSSAYHPAYIYAIIGLELLGNDSWSMFYNLTLNLHLEAINATYLNRNIEELSRLIDTAMSNAKTLSDKVSIYQAQIHVLKSENKMTDIVKIATDVLKQLGIRLPKGLYLLHFLPLFVRAKHKLKRFSDDELMNLPVMEKPKKLSAMRLLAVTSSAAYQSAPDLVLVICCKFVLLTLKHGIAPESAYGFAAYGLVLTAMGDIEEGNRFGKIALELSERPSSKKLKGRTMTLVNIFIRHWKKHWSVSYDWNINAYRTALDYGDIEYAGHTAHLICRNLYWMGEPLSAVHDEFVNYKKFLNKTKDKHNTHFQNIYHQAIHNLRKNECDIRFNGPYFDQNSRLPELTQKENFDKSSVFLFYLNKLVICYLFGDKLESIHSLRMANKHNKISLGQSIAVILAFYESLILISIFEQSNFIKKKIYLRRIAANQRKIKHWSTFCEENCQNKYYLVNAELLRLKQDFSAIRFYTKAIESAGKNGFLQEEALANELAVKFYISAGQDNIANNHFHEAIYLYERWGAKAKIKQLINNYPQFKRPDVKTIGFGKNPVVSTFMNTGGSSTNVLDLITIIKASHAISGNIILNDFLRQMITIVMENAGAQKAHLILNKDDNWYIEASSSVELDFIRVLQSIPLEGDQNKAELILPISLINYIISTEESLVLDDVLVEKQFLKDEYIKREKPRSLLCIPIKNQGRTKGILYLENSHTTHAFTPDRVELLQMLSSQIAISIDNAVLYKKLEEYNQSLEENVDRRTTELREQNILLQKAREEAERASKAKSEFLANMSHELRTPMHAILGYAKLSISKVNTIKKEVLIDYLTEIRDSGERLLHLLNNLLDLSKMKAGKVKYEFGNNSISKIVKMIMNELAILSEKKEIEMKFAEPQFNDITSIDTEKISQVIRNLLSNAIKFSDVNSQIHIEIENQADEFTISVIDNGIGVPQSELNIIFDKFTQSSITKNGAGGTGLGLSICKEIVTEHSGKIWAEQNMNGGAIFRFTLPKLRRADNRISS